MGEKIEYQDQEKNRFTDNMTTHDLNKVLAINENFKDFLKVIETYGLKKVARNCSNFYYDSKEKVSYERKETTAEHVYSAGKLADYFLFSEDEFLDLDRLKVNDLIKYHDDVEIETEDTCISQEKEREHKSKSEVEALPILAAKYPKKLQERLLQLDAEYRDNKTPEAKFVHAIDKMDALVHEIEYPQDR